MKQTNLERFLARKGKCLGDPETRTSPLCRQTVSAAGVFPLEARTVLGPKRSDTGRLEAATGASFDLLVIGGGIVGCGIARDAALRSLRTALFEREDFGAGTSSRSTRLIHGGLRYLELLDFRLVREDLREREILLATAPHRVKPLAFLVPLYHRSPFYRLKLRVGMTLYDLLSAGKSLPNHRRLDRLQALHAEPGLKPAGLQGATLYYDAQVAFVERLCLDNVLDAAKQGACAFNHTEVVGLHRGGQGQVDGVIARDTLTGAETTVLGKVIVNAAGPWLDRLAERLTSRPAHRLRLTKGVHFAAPPAVQHALVVFSETDERLVFVVPWSGYAWVGTTDTDLHEELDTVHATGEEVRYLQDAVGAILPDADWQTIYFTHAGVRALVRKEGAKHQASQVSRRHRLVTHTAAEGLDGMISVLGGKITAYRHIAEETVDAVERRLRSKAGSSRPARSHPRTTAGRPLPGGDFQDAEALLEQARQRAAQCGLDREQADHLVFLYGSRYDRILDRIRQDTEMGARLAAPYPNMRAEIYEAVEQEFARTASDFLMRRSGLFFSLDQGRTALPAVVAELARIFSWDTAHQQSETAAYLAQVALTQVFRQESSH